MVWTPEPKSIWLSALNLIKIATNIRNTSSAIGSLGLKNKEHQVKLFLVRDFILLILLLKGKKTIQHYYEYEYTGELD